MGRNSTGACTTWQCLRIGINNFSKDIPKENGRYAGYLKWNTDSSINYILTRYEGEIFLTLNYTAKINGEQVKVNYQITIIPALSNLGWGFHYYFICPTTLKKCKILYLAYGSKYFKSREAYTNRIYYPSQISSKNSFHNDRYWYYERKVKELEKKHPKTHYRGRDTAAQLKIYRYEEKRNYHDNTRWIFFNADLNKIMGKKKFS